MGHGVVRLMREVHVLSVLEHLDVKPRHLVTTSMGI